MRADSPTALIATDLQLACSTYRETYSEDVIAERIVTIIVADYQPDYGGLMRIVFVKSIVSVALLLPEL